jgi:hypothetical protein
MSMTFEVDHERKQLKVTASGPVSLDDITTHLREEEDAHALGYRELIDAGAATATLSSAEVRSVVATLRDLGRKGDFGPTAIIVSDDVTYGICRMLEFMLDDVCDVRPYRVSERAEAEQWLAAAPIRGGQGAP